ncbi:hypothetical protein [Bacillus sp. FJAT-45037]|uniref:hypothetical protein n=1 Tax=Bacillus sp. FJAT-45037 TaxID=2011007 RepID=UPI000C23B4FF|nr:hypothetical protein [Bacillus sp. FJAT-45037]
MKLNAIFSNKHELDTMFLNARGDGNAVHMAHEFEGTLKSHGLEVTIDEINFARASYMAWNYQAPLEKPIAWSAPAGFGKSTMLETWATYNGNSNNVLWGAIIAKPQRKQVIEFCKKVNSSTGGKLTASPLLGRGEGMTEEVYLEQFKAQERAPILVVTHKMLELLVSQNKLSNYMEWIDEEGNTRRRTNLIIDERPTFTETPKLTTTNIERLTELVRSVSMASTEYHKGYVMEIEKVAEKLKAKLKRPIEQGGRQTFNIEAIDPLFEVPSELFYDWIKFHEVVSGDYNLLGTFSEAIKRGGTCESNSRGVGLVVGRTVWQKLTSMNTHILDASAVGDVNYEVAPFNIIAPVIPEKAYSKITVKNCYEHNIGRSFFDNHKDGFKQTVKLAKEVSKSHNKTLVVVYKKHFSKYQKALELEEAMGKIMLKYFDDERSSNDFQHCDSVLFLGMNRKTPAYYIETARAIFGEDFSTEFNTRGGQKFESEAIQGFFESDISADRHQGIGRLRGYKSNVDKTIYMFCTFENVIEQLKEDFEGATFEDWKLPFSITGKEKEKTSLENYIEYLKTGGFEKVKCSYVYKEVLGASRSQWSRIKDTPEVLEVMEQEGLAYEGNSLIEK